MDSLLVIHNVAKNYALDWGMDVIINILTHFIDKNCYGNEFELHCTQCAAQDLKNKCQALREEAEKEAA